MALSNTRVNLYNGLDQHYLNFERDSKKNKQPSFRVTKVNTSGQGSKYQVLNSSYNVSGMIHKLSYLTKTIKNNKDDTGDKKVDFLDLLIVDQNAKDYYIVSIPSGIFSVQVMNRLFNFSDKPTLKNEDFIQIKLNKKQQQIEGEWEDIVNEKGDFLTDIRIFTAASMEDLNDKEKRTHLNLTFWNDEKSEDKNPHPLNSKFLEIRNNCIEYKDMNRTKLMEYMFANLDTELSETLSWMKRNIKLSWSEGVEYTNPYVNKLLTANVSGVSDVTETIYEEDSSMNDTTQNTQPQDAVMATAEEDDDLPF